MVQQGEWTGNVMKEETQGLLKESMHRYWRMIAKTWPVLLLVFVPIEIVYIALIPDDPEAPQAYMTSQKWGNILYCVFGILADAVVYRFVAADRANRSLSCWRLMAEGCSAWGRLFKANLISSVVIFFLLLCLVVPGIVWCVFYAFTTGCVVIGGLGPVKALEESKRMVKGRWWVTFWMMLGLYGMSYVVGILASIAVEEVSVWLYFLSLDFIFPESDAAGIACNAGFVAAEVLMDIICLFARVGMAVFYLRLVATRQEDVREGATGLVACMS